MSDLPELPGRRGKLWDQEYDELRRSLREEVGLTPDDTHALLVRNRQRLRLAWLAADERETSTLRQAVALMGSLYFAGVSLLMSLTGGSTGDGRLPLIPLVAGGALALVLSSYYILVCLMVAAPASRIRAMRDELLANGWLKDSQGDSGGQPHSQQPVAESKESTAPLTNGPRYGAILRKLVRRVRRHE